MRTPLRPSDPRHLGVYRLEARLGQGGMGTVYLGRDPHGRPVAIKTVKPEFAYEEEFRARFRSEVNRARQVPPFCTAELLDADADHETPYLVVEYVDGPSLAEVVAEQGPLTGGNLHSVALGVATALAAIHGAGVIHRDLKPQNVLFSLGTPKVIDFGIARALEATSQHTGTDQMVGTVAYMAPERFDTDSARIGPAADVFAWGVVVTYAGTGRTPFGGDSAAATAGAILTRPPRLDGLPAPLRDLVARTLDKDPARRPTAFDLLDELVTAGAATTAELPGRPEPQRAARAARRTSGNPNTTRTSRRRRRTTAALAAAGVLAVTGGILTLTPAQHLVFGAASLDDATATSAPPSSPAPRATTGRGPVLAPTVRKTPPARLCTDADVEITITAQSDDPTDAGPQRGLISVANRSTTACRINGRVFVSLYNAADERVPVPTTAVDEPDEAVDILLRPGTGAFQGIKWQTCDRDDADCPTGNSLRASLTRTGRGAAAELEEFPDPSRSQITMKSLKIGTVQPSTQGVVAW
jgi:eukaryotic-like serine/threonine-protein kinase